MSQEPEVIGNWVREKVLGSGAFGIVMLWKNRKTNEQIAVKKFKGIPGSVIPPKQKERWTKEVEMMQTLIHPNIVSYYKLPTELDVELQKYNVSKLPMLSMEFCEGGDLRRVISKAENCCGLTENDVRNALFDLSSAVSHLHKLGITHRDLKPENVVLCPSENRLLCKLIDLGYAKEIDCSSVPASLVGTLQYLAPEFFYSKTYSCSVDYWSLGLVAFELACGSRPFLTNMSPAQWMKHVENKKFEDICIWQDNDRKILFRQEIWEESHISSWLREELSKWLRIALEFNPKKRGREPAALEAGPIIFAKLRSILQQKVISVFCVPVLKCLNYQIDDYTLVDTLCGWVERDTKIIKEDQIMFSNQAAKINTEQLVIQYFDKTYTVDPMIYVFKKSEILKEEIPPKVPDLVSNVLENVNMQYHFQKQSYAHSLYFIFKENRIYNTLLDSCQLRLTNIESTFLHVKNTYKTMTENIEKLNAQKEFSKSLLDFDYERYLEHFCQNATHWVDTYENISKEINKLLEISQKLVKRVESANRRITTIKNEGEKKYSKFSKHNLDKLLNDALELYRTLKNKPKDKRTKPESCTPMLTLVYSALKEHKNLLTDKTFGLYQQKILDLELEVEKMSLPLNTALEHIEKIKTELLEDNLSRQTTIWELTIKPKHVPQNNQMPNSSEEKDDIYQDIKNYPNLTSMSQLNISQELPEKQSALMEKYKIEQPTIAKSEPKPEFKIGNPQDVDYGEPISLKSPAHFILGQIEEQLPSHATQTSPTDEEITVPSTSMQNGVLPKFIIGAPTSILINENHNLRYQLEEKTNESFLHCKSILNENLDFSFLSE